MSRSHVRILFGPSVPSTLGRDSLHSYRISFIEKLSRSKRLILVSRYAKHTRYFDGLPARREAKMQ